MMFARGNKLYAKVRGVDGKWRQKASGFDVGDEKRAEKWHADLLRDIANTRAVAGDSPLTLRVYVETWIKRRKTKTVRDDRTRLEKHVLPRIGDLMLDEVRPRHARDVIVALRNEAALAPKTIREVSGVLHAVFKSAMIDELVTANPVVFERGVLPKKVDKDPTWRAQAIFTRGEIEAIISDDRIANYRRVLYALKFFTGRHSEVACLTWGQYDATLKPLGQLQLGLTKSGVPRLVPVHPTLAKILAAWKLSGWEARQGRAPRADDIIVPTLKGKRRSANETQREFVADLERLGLRTRAGAARKRRGHDMRRTLITLARSDGAIDGVLRLITHGPKASDMLDVYSTMPWEVLCTEIGKLKISLLEGRVIAMAANDSHGIRGAVVVQSSDVGVSATEKERPRRDSNPFSVSRPDTSRQRKRPVGSGARSGNVDQLHQTAPNEIRTQCDVGLALIMASAEP